MTNGGPGLSTRIMSLRIWRTASEFLELGAASAASSYLLMLLLVLTMVMYVFNKTLEARQRRLRRMAQEEAS